MPPVEGIPVQPTKGISGRIVHGGHIRAARAGHPWPSLAGPVGKMRSTREEEELYPESISEDIVTGTSPKA